jgi:hypothetical protein
MSQPVDPENHPLLPENDESELRYDERTTEDEPDKQGADSQEPDK